MTSRPDGMQALSEALSALDVVRQALNDWTADYAWDFCDEDKVVQARARLGEFGTLSYISEANAAQHTVREYLEALRAGEGAGIPEGDEDSREIAWREAQLAEWTRLHLNDLLRAGEVLAPWMAACLGDNAACAEIKEAADKWLTAHSVLMASAAASPIPPGEGESQGAG